MTPQARAARRARLLGFDRLSLFVPAVMSVGVIFWIVSEVVEVGRSRAEQVRHTRARVVASEVTSEVLGRPQEQLPGLRPRPVYLLITLVLVGTVAYVAIGSIANFARRGSYVEGIAWLLALAMATCAVALLFAATAFTVFVRWPRPPAWAQGMALRSPLGSPTFEGRLEGRPSWKLGVCLGVSATLAALIVAFVAWSPENVHEFNANVSEWFADRDALGSVAWLQPAGYLWLAVPLALVAAVLALRCRVVVACYVISLLAGVLLTATLRPLVAQARPADDPLATQLDSFPSGSLLYIVLFAGLFPLALAVFFGRKGVVAPLRAVLAVFVVASATHAIATGQLPIDVLGGVLIGLTLVLASEWVIDTRPSHDSCNGCPWSPEPYTGSLRHAIPISATGEEAWMIVARVSAAAATVLLSLVIFDLDVPADVSELVQVVSQFGLVATATAGALLAWRFATVAAGLFAITSVGAGLFSAVDYAPATALALAAAMLVPAILLVLTRRRDRRRIGAALAVVLVSISLLAGTWFGANAVHDRFS
jgi:hypothetical protein